MCHASSLDMSWLHRVARPSPHSSELVFVWDQIRSAILVRPLTARYHSSLKAYAVRGSVQSLGDSRLGLCLRAELVPNFSVYTGASAAGIWRSKHRTKDLQNLQQDLGFMEHIIEKVKPYGMLTAGALFGAGWWAWCDVILRSALVNQTSVGAAYYIPGIVATIAVILMACIQRDDADGYIGYDSEGETCRTKCGLFVAYCASFGSIAAAVVILLMIRQNGGDLNIGVGAVCQTAIICLSGLVTWLCKSSEGSEYSLLGW